MNWLLLAFLLLSVLLGFVVFLGGPPYVPTLRRNMDAALDLLIQALQ